jgi:hypothetical protein
MFYKTPFNPLITGNHLSYIDKYGSKFHTIRPLKKYIKMNTTLITYNSIKRLYKSQYYANKKIVIVKYYYYKFQKINNNLDNTNKNNIDTNIFENYIKEFIDPNIKVIWKLNNSPGKVLHCF